MRAFVTSFAACRRRAGNWLLPAAALQLACGGCWEEIRYVPKPETAETSPAGVSEGELESLSGVSAIEAAPSLPPSLPPEEPVLPPGPPTTDELFSAAAPDVEPDPAVGSDVGVEALDVAAGGDEAVLPTPVEGDASLLDGVGGEGAGGETPRLAGEATDEQRLLVWRAASKWSLAAAFHAKRRDTLRETSLNSAKAAATTLNIELPPLPSASQPEDLGAAVIEGLRGESAVALVNAVADRFGGFESAAADLAIRSHLLLLTYSPRGSDAAMQIEALRRTAEASGLPADVWEPLAKLLEERAPFLDVRQAVFDLHRRAEGALSAVADGRE